LRETYGSRCTTLHREVRVHLPGDRLLEGTAVDVDGDARLVVRRDNGSEEAVAAGDVVHVR
jgi:BirA family biotin operon repressor/biotin-[acetyl-CoA-carboxylase] ligase